MRMLPIGFQTDYVKNIRGTMEELDKVILGQMPDEKDKPFLIDFSIANSIIDMIEETLVFERDWEWEPFKSCMEFLSKNTEKKAMHTERFGAW